MTTADRGSVIGEAGAEPAAAAGAVLTTRRRLPPSLAALWERLRSEAADQAERWFLWAPVAAGSGVAVYLGLRSEPPLVLLMAGWAVVLSVAVLGAFRWRSRLATTAAMLLLFAVTGFSGAGLRTALLAAPVLPQATPPVMVEGWVVDVASASAERPRLLIAPVRIEGVAQQDLPERVRISLRQPMLVGPGRAIRVRAILNPPPPPASPGSYDFARDAYFQRVGGSGLALGSPLVVNLAPASFALKIDMAVNAARWSLARRLVERMGPQTGGFAAALVTGHKAWLSEADTEAMRASGLAHLLAISGMHMAIVGGFTFAAFRLGVAAWPWVALRVSGKKVAAVAGLVAVLTYLVISGGPPSAERAAITASVAFAAILLDRRVLTLHSLAIAALAVLAFQPEAVAYPGFQMSFAATAALLALVEAWPRPLREIKAPWAIVAIQRLRTWAVAAFLISFTAGMATGPFAIQHFNRITWWGLPANLATQALSSLMVMPALAIGAALEMIGLSSGPLSVAHHGLQATRALAHYFGGLPGAVVIVASAPAWALPVSFLGLLFVCLWKGRLRWLGLPLFAAVSLAPRPAAPDVWIASGGANVAVREANAAVVLRPRTQTFASDLWSRRRGLATPTEAEAALRRWYVCGRDACYPEEGAPVRVAAWWRLIPPSPAQIERLCAGAELVIVRTGLVPEGACPGRTILDEADLSRGGAAELHRTPEGWKATWAQDLRGLRPWTTSVGGEED